jgi:hypothetical protein
MTAVEYRRRASLTQTGEDLWRAYPDRLEQVGPDGALRMTVPYRNVQAVRLAFAPGRFQTSRFVMELQGTRSQLVLSNMHFVGIGNFEDRSETFLPLVRAVVAGIAAANPAARFTAGERPAFYWLMLAFNAFAFGMLALLLLTLPIVPGNISASVMIKAVVILFTLPLLFSWAMNSRPRRFNPASGLENVLAARGT